MSEATDARVAAVNTAMEGVRALFARQELGRDSLAEVENLMKGLLQHQALFGAEDFPDPTQGQEATIYLLAEDEGSANALYLVCAVAGTKAPPHDHQTWACIGGINGEEDNRVYERLDDGSVAGKGEVKEVGRVVLRNGDCLAFMPDDIHSIEAKDGSTRHLHWYGKGFNEQFGRVAFMDGACFEIPTGMLPVDDSRKVI
jgi:predicted metal-dependent enzyme (double-stranded beta helix superfamily)